MVTEIAIPKTSTASSNGFHDPRQEGARQLRPDHEQQLLDSGISKTVIYHRGYESVTAEEFAHNPKLAKFSVASRLSGLLIPHCNTGGMRYQLKPDNPLQDSRGKPKKYLFEQGSRKFIDTLHSPPGVLNDPCRPIVIIEGIKKGDALASHPFGQGLSIIILDSCTSGLSSGEKKELQEPLLSMVLEGRTVYVCLDADLATNKNVWDAANKLRERLLEKNAAVRFVEIPPGETGKEGLDDYIAGNGDPENLFNKAKAALPPQPPPKPRGRPPNPRPKIDSTGCVFIPHDCASGYRSFREALKALGLEVRLNERGALTEYRALSKSTVPGYPLEDWTPASDQMESTIREIMCERVLVRSPGDGEPELSRYRISKGNFPEFLSAATARKRVDPFEDYVLSQSWDGEPRIDLVLCDAFGCEATEINRTISSRIFIWAVERTLFPGTKQDIMPILVGRQGIGKSTFLRNIFPHPSFFTDAFSFSMPYTRQIEATNGVVLVEVSELIGLRRQEQSACKAYLSMQEDKTRPAYGRRTESYPRRFIIVGTSNDDGTGVLPDDPTGSRRYAVVVCKDESEIDFGVRSQWWAEALQRVQSGEDTRIPRELYEDQAAVNAKFRHPQTIMEEKLRKFLGSEQSRNFSGKSWSEIWRRAYEDEEVGGQPLSDKRVANMACRVLRNCQWTKDHRRDGDIWWHPDPSH